MNKSQYKFGKGMVKKFAKKHTLTYSQALHIIEDITTIKDMYEWVNMGGFLCMEINRLLFLLLEKKKTGKRDE